MPAALVELDFLSNPIHEELFNRPDVLAQYAAAISDGILKYLSIK
jgi:N-acetylmuramoyl-L-alanine amidase